MHPMTKRLTLIAGAVFVLSAATAGGLLAVAHAQQTGSATHTRSTVPHGGHHLVGAIAAPSCDGGYAIAHAAVTVRDEHGTIIASGTTGDPDTRDTSCAAAFTLDVPAATFYQIRIGTHDGPVWSAAELAAQNWSPILTLR